MSHNVEYVGAIVSEQGTSYNISIRAQTDVGRGDSLFVSTSTDG